jgi:SAM-dependent methyltransferase
MGEHMQSDHKSAWEASYANRDNFLFHPHEEVIRFVARFVRKRVGLDAFVDVASDPGARRVLDLGCGIGRHVIYCAQMGLQAYGVDLSESAVQTAREWAKDVLGSEAGGRIVQGDVRQLPWASEYFDFGVSHGVLDSMPFALARAACGELARVMKAGGLFYCDLVSGDDSRHAREFTGEERVTTAHERGTIQLYFNYVRVCELFAGLFEIVECVLIRREDVLKGSRTARYHLVLRRTR